MSFRRDTVLKTATRICDFILQPGDGGEKGEVTVDKTRIWVPEFDLDCCPIQPSKSLETNEPTAPLPSLASAVINTSATKGRLSKQLPPIEHSVSPLDSKQVSSSSQRRVFFLGASSKVHVEHEITSPITPSATRTNLQGKIEKLVEERPTAIIKKNECTKLPNPSRQDMMRILNIQATFAEALAMDYNLASCSFMCAPEAKAASREQIITVLIKLVQTMCVFVSGNALNQKAVYTCLEVFFLIFFMLLLFLGSS